MLTAAEHSLFTRATEINSPEALLSATREFVNSGSLRRLLRACLLDRAQIAETAARSYRHDNGFWKIVLAETAAYQLRAHVWPASQRVSTGVPNIHNHRWHFGSVLLRGGYTQELFAVCHSQVDGFPVHRWIYRPSADRIGGRLAEIGAGRLNRVSWSEYRRCHTVRLDASELHRVIPAANTQTISVVVNGPMVRAETDVYTPDRLAVLPEDVGRRLNGAEVEAAVTDLSDALADYERQTC